MGDAVGAMMMAAMGAIVRWGGANGCQLRWWWWVGDDGVGDDGRAMGDECVGRCWAVRVARAMRCGGRCAFGAAAVR